MVSRSEEAVKELEEQLSCAVCLRLYVHPKVLTCHHVFCAECLSKCTNRNDLNQAVVVCPSCRRGTPLTAGGVAELPASFQTNQLLDLLQRLSEPKEPPPAATNECSIHEGKVLELWCDSCQERLCFHCSLDGEKHHGHKYILLTEAHKQAKEDIKVAIAPLVDHKTKVNAAFDDAMRYLDRLQHEKEAAREAILLSTNKLQDAIAAFKSTALMDLDVMAESKVRQVTPYKIQLETSLSQLDNCIRSVEKKLAEDNPEGLVSHKRSLCLKAAQLVQEFRPESLSRSYEGSIKFKFSEDILREAIQNSFLLFYSDVYPSKCKLSGLGLVKAHVGKESTVTLDLLTAEGEPTKVEVKDVQCELKSDITGKTVDVSMTHLNPGKVDFHYSPVIKGRHILSVRVEADHVHGSPCSVAVESLGTDYASAMNTIETLSSPLGAVVLEDGRVLVTSVTARCMAMHDQRGNLLCNIDRTSYTSIALRRGSTVFAVDRDRAVFEVDVDNASSASLIFSAPQFAYIGDVAFDSSNNILFMLYYDLIGSDKPRYVESYCLSTTEKTEFGEQGTKNGQLNSPKGLTIDSKTSRLYVADTNNHRVQVFSSKGKYLSKFGKEGSSPGSLTLPTAVAVYQEKVFVGDTISCVSVFSVKNHHYLFNIGVSCGVDKIESLYLDRSGVLYVCDANKSRVLLF